MDNHFFLRSLANSAAFFASITNGADGALRLLATFPCCLDPGVCPDTTERDDDDEEVGEDTEAETRAAEAMFRTPLRPALPRCVDADPATEPSDPCHRPISRNSAPAFVFLPTPAVCHSIRFPPRFSAGTGNGRLVRSHQNGKSFLPLLFPTPSSASSK